LAALIIQQPRFSGSWMMFACAMHSVLIDLPLQWSEGSIDTEWWGVFSNDCNGQ
jgi:hypothetical protein